VAVIVIGGHSRNVGKTSVVAGLIAALPEARWTAMKITQFGHGVCSVTSEPCGCALNETGHAWSADQEFSRKNDTDTSRFLVSGAKESWWIRTKQGQLALAMPRIREILSASQNVIIESNSIIRFIKPDLYIQVLDPATADFKDSSREFLDRADAIILHSTSAVPDWENVSLKTVADRPVFRIMPPRYVTDELVGFVQEKLSAMAQLTSRS
jgi:hypothetical protein